MAKADIMAGRAYVSLYMKDRLTRDLRAVQQRMNKFGADMMSLGTKMVAMSAAIATPIGFATKKFAEFDDAMRSVKAVTSAGSEEFAEMTAKAKELGRTTSFTAVQVASLMTELGRAGFRPDEINRMTGAVMNLARATGTDAALSAGIVSATLRQFALDAGNAARVSDVLTKAANSTFNTVEGLGESLKYAGPVAKELGMSLEDTVAILGSLGNVGIQGSDAGTALRRLGVISASSGKKLRALFGVINTDATGNMKPLAQIMDEIGRASDKMDTTEKMEKMKEAFGLLGITAASAMSRSAGSTIGLAESLRNAEGAAQSAAQEMDKGLGGAFRIVMSAAEGLQIAIGDALQGSLTAITKSITAILGKATEWIGKNQELVTTAAAITVAVGAAGVALVTLGISAKLAAVGIGISATAIGMLKTSALLAMAALKIFGAISLSVGMSMYALTSAIAIANTAVAIFTASGGVMSAAWATVGAVMSGVWAVIIAPVTPFIVAAGAAAAAIAGIAAAAGIATIRGTQFSAAWEYAKQKLMLMIEVAKRLGGILMDALAGGDYDIAFRVAMASLKIALASGLDSMAELWGMFWAGAWDFGKRFFSNLMSMTWKVVKAIAKALSNPLKAASTMKKAFGEIISGDVLLGVGLDTSKMRTQATAEIERLEKELDERKKKREAEAAAKGNGEGGKPSSSTGAGAETVDPETAALELKLIQAKDEELRLKQEANDEAKRLEQEASQRTVRHIQDFADAAYENGISSEEVAEREKRAIAYKNKTRQIDEDTAKEALLQVDIRKEERDHQAKLAKFKNKGKEKPDETNEPSQFKVQSGGASAATFSARSLMAMGTSTADTKQVKTLVSMKKLMEDQTTKQQLQADKQLAATKKAVPKHA